MAIVRALQLSQPKTGRGSTGDAAHHCGWLARNDLDDQCLAWSRGGDLARSYFRGSDLQQRLRARVHRVDHWNAFVAAHKGMTDAEIEAECVGCGRMAEQATGERMEKKPNPNAAAARGKNVTLRIWRGRHEQVE